MIVSENIDKLPARMLIKVSCDCCGKEIDRMKYQALRYENHYCDNTCQAKQERQLIREKILQKGEKSCGLCKKSKRLNEFNKSQSTPDGYNNNCRDCSRKSSRKYYEKNKEKHKKTVSDRNKKVIKENRQKLFLFYTMNPCIDCGEQDPLVLESDHKKGVEKKGVISQMVWKCSWKTVEKELEKCEVRCANCHRRKTALEQDWYKDIELQ